MYLFVHSLKNVGNLSSQFLYRLYLLKTSKKLLIRILYRLVFFDLLLSVAYYLSPQTEEKPQIR